MSFYAGRRVLVTGAGGFIGSHLTERLVSSGAKVRAFVHYNSTGGLGWLAGSDARDKAEIFPGDITDQGSVRKAMEGTEIVFHLAALIAIPYSYRAPGSYVRTNVEGTLNMLHAALDFKVARFVHTSTSEVYGTARQVPIREDHPLQGQSPYSASKIGADKMVEAFHCSFGLPAVTVRPFNTFGPRQSARAVIPTIITQCLAGQDVKLGNLAPTRDMNFVANTVDGFLAAAQSQAAIGKAMNFGSGREISIGELAKLIIKLVGKPVSIVADQNRMRPENSEVERLLADFSLANSLAGWKPGISLEDGLIATIEWIRGNLDKYRIGQYAI